MPQLYLKLHIITIALSCLAFFVATAAAVLYLVQNNLLKHKQAGIISNCLPNLFLLDKLNYRAIVLGFPMLTFSIFFAFFRADYFPGTYFNFSTREIYAFMLWVIYAIILHVRLSARLRGRRVAQLSLVAFCVFIFALFASCR